MSDCWCEYLLGQQLLVGSFFCLEIRGFLETCMYAEEGQACVQVSCYGWEAQDFLH
jgi:hypothetical protein